MWKPTYKCTNHNLDFWAVGGSIDDQSCLIVVYNFCKLLSNCGFQSIFQLQKNVSTTLVVDCQFIRKQCKLDLVLEITEIIETIKNMQMCNCQSTISWKDLNSSEWPARHNYTHAYLVNEPLNFSPLIMILYKVH